MATKDEMAAVQASLEKLQLLNTSLTEKVEKLEAENEELRRENSESQATRIEAAKHQWMKLDEEAVRTIDDMVKVWDRLTKYGVNKDFFEENTKVGEAARQLLNEVMDERDMTPFENVGSEEMIEPCFGVDGDCSAGSLRRFIERYRVVKELNTKSRLTGWDSPEFRAGKLKLCLVGDPLDYISFESSMAYSWTNDDEKIIGKLMDKFMNLKDIELNIVTFEKSFQDKESLGEYLSRLRRLVKDAYHGDSPAELNRKVAWKFVRGVDDGNIKKKLLKSGWLKDRRNAKPLDELLRLAEKERNQQRLLTLIWIDSIERVSEVIEDIKTEELIALDCEGDKLGRTPGTLEILTIATRNNTYLFDITEMGMATFDGTGLKEVLEGSACEKLMFDCRNDADALLHNYNVRLRTVLDLQLLEAVQYLANQTPKPSGHVHKNWDFQRLIKQYASDLLATKKRGTEEKKIAQTNIWIDRPLSDILQKYCAVDTLALFKVFDKILESDNSLNLDHIRAASERYVDYTRSLPPEVIDNNSIHYGYLFHHFLPHNILQDERGPESDRRKCRGCTKMFAETEFPDFREEKMFCRVCRRVNKGNKVKGAKKKETKEAQKKEKTQKKEKSGKEKSKKKKENNKK